MIFKLMEYWWPGDRLVRWQIRRLHTLRLRQESAGGLEAQRQRLVDLVLKLESSPRALATNQANDQHYEVAPDFYQLVLGPHLKYSCGYWPTGQETLEQSEEAMLDLYCQRAQLQDGQQILDLGCGWGSLSLYLARRYPRSHILGVSNSSSQAESIRARASQQGLTNLQIWTCDINRLELPSEKFDRILSIEMLEHVRNYRSVFNLLRAALAPKGKLFLHVFAHHRFPYAFEPSGHDSLGGDWMEREFFTGGMMPSFDLFPQFAAGLRREREWVVNGLHYHRTCEAWLEQLRRQRPQVLAIFKRDFPRDWRKKWLGWQLFFLACSELFAYQAGNEWAVHHTLWSKDG